MAVLNKAQRFVFEALMAIGERQPFEYQGIDSDYTEKNTMPTFALNN